MSAMDWNSVDAHAVSLPSIVSSSDLFDGELFGDELIDIYNTSVDDHGANSVHNEIPNLMDHHHQSHDNNLGHHPGAEMAMTAASMDDGMGPFRPSTSFNDLTNLLQGNEMSNNTTGVQHAEAPVQQQQQQQQPPAMEMVNQPAPAPTVSMAPVVPTSSDITPTAAVTKPTKKRTASVSSPDTPAAKRRGSTGRAPKRASMSKKQSAAAAAAQAAKAGETGNDDTPNPLGGPEVPAAVASSDVLAPSAVAVQAAAAPPAVTPTPAVALPSQPPASIVNRSCSDMTEESVPVAQVALSSNSSVGSESLASESDFKSMAQAAVSNLIANMESKKNDMSSNSSVGSKIDTSTAHIKALTGNNWVTACAGVNTNVSVVAPSGDSKATNRARRQNLTPDERARQNRDRNREHARNTRLRKKAYVEELKRTLSEIVAQRDAAEFEKRQSAQRELEQREVRFRVIEEFLKLRARNEVNYARWAAILEDGFTFTIPVTDYRKMAVAPKGSEQVLTGVHEVMADSGMFSAFLQTLMTENNNHVVFQYTCERKDFFMDGCTAFLHWTATSVGATNDLVVQGTVKGKFCPASNKLLSAQMSFNVGSVLAQIPHIVDRNKCCNRNDEVAAAAAAAQAAATQADAILDSLQMPRLSTVHVPMAVTLVPPCSSSSASEVSDKGETDCFFDEQEHEGLAA